MQRRNNYLFANDLIEGVEGGSIEYSETGEDES